MVNGVGKPEDHSLYRWASTMHAQLGLPPGLVTHLPDSGSVNFVFIIGTGSERWVIRTPKDPLATDVFAAERWCATQAQAVGVPTPPISFAGSSEGRQCSVQPFVDGRRGDDLSQGNGLWPVLGEYGLRINRIQPTSDAPATLFTRFGRDVPTAWAAHLDYNLDQLDGQDELVRRGTLSRDDQELVRTSARRLQAVPQRFGLSHGDLALRNVIVPERAEPVLIDWGSASFGPVPWADLLIADRDRRKTGAPSMEGVVQFARAAGVDIVAQWDIFASYRLLHHVDLVRWAIERRPDRIPDTVAALREVLNDHTTPAHHDA